jgi:hypothetical protein
VAEEGVAEFPAGLLSWAGNRSGGVRRLFDMTSGRPGQAVLETNLLHRLRDWTGEFASGDAAAPRVLLLVGGPGNGKTEAIESTARWLDRALGANSRLTNELSSAFAPADGLVPRVVTADLDALLDTPGWGQLEIVQDASVVTGPAGLTAAQLLLAELTVAVGGAEPTTYLCCVNRGVLDDALIEAIDAGDDQGRRLLEAVTRAVSLFPDAPPCWPLPDFPSVAVWPMDVESLLAPLDSGDPAPAVGLFGLALAEEKWRETGSCEAGSMCPFCTSRSLLAKPRERASLLSILRWYEVSSGKRWSFRDLFSLASYLLAGNQGSGQDVSTDPCSWASALVVRDDLAKRKAKPSKPTSTAIFQLVAAHYQHALFHRWDRDAGASLLRDLKELGLDDDNTAMGLHWFLQSRRGQYLPTTITAALEGVVDLMDPAAASPDTELQATQRTTFWLRDIDVRFSRSVAEGLDYVRKSRVLQEAELELLGRLATLDAELSQGQMRRKRPAVATRVQRLIRDFACRIVRRSLGVRTATVRDATILAEFQRVTEEIGGDGLYEVAREVERLLNTNQDFEISLTTTFGQPLPPPMQRATLVVPARPVKPLEEVASGRPRSPVAFLRVGSAKSVQAVALTYDLFKAVKELQRGMSPASLPKTVQALLDTARARLSGSIVRDREILDRARIRIGSGGVAVEERRQGFVSFREEQGR